MSNNCIWKLGCNPNGIYQNRLVGDLSSDKSIVVRKHMRVLLKDVQ